MDKGGHIPRYSIIIPFFNAERFLRECMDSVLAQTCGNWECFCIDDGSEDSSRTIVEEYAGMDDRITVLRQIHSGVGAARNAGLSRARGRYLIFVDADDRLLPNALQSLNDETADIVTFLEVPGKEGGKRLSVEVSDASDCLYSRVFGALGGNLLVWNAIYLRERIKDLCFPDLINCEDLVYCAWAFAKARTVAMGIECWYYHRDVEGSAANSHSWRRTVDSFKSIPLMLSAYRGAMRGWRMWYILARKLTMHFILHVVCEIPRCWRCRGEVKVRGEGER